MRCDNCKAVNKDGRKFCKRCGSPLDSCPVQPSWRWSLKVLGVIYLSLAGGYVLLRILL